MRLSFETKDTFNLYSFIHHLDYVKTSSLDNINLCGSTVQNLRNGVKFALGAGFSPILLPTDNINLYGSTVQNLRNGVKFALGAGFSPIILTTFYSPIYLRLQIYTTYTIVSSSGYSRTSTLYKAQKCII